MSGRHGNRYRDGKVTEMLCESDIYGAEDILTIYVSNVNENYNKKKKKIMFDE